MSIVKQKADAISAMKTISIALVLVFVLLSSGAAQIPQTDEEVWEEIRIHSGIPLQDIEELRTAPPAVAWKFFRGLAQGYGHREIGRDLVRRAGRVIADNEAVGDLVREQLAKIPHDFYTSGQRSHLLLPLGSIPAPWSARLLGQYLMDPTPMTPGEPLLDYSASSNAVLALAALSRMGFADAPTKDYIPLIRAGTMESWKDWWTKNESRIDERIREINPDYQPVSSPATTTILEADAWKDIQRLNSKFSQLANPDSLAEADPELTWKFFSLLHQRKRFKPESRELVRQAGLAVARNPRVQAMLEEELKIVPSKYQKEQGSLSTLGGVPAPWAARLLGRYLMDLTPVEPDRRLLESAEIDCFVRVSSNQGRAARGLAAMGFSDAPTEGEIPNLTPDKMAAWRAWWTKNESRIDERIREINPDSQISEITAEIADRDGQYFVRFLKPSNIWLFFRPTDFEHLVYDVEFFKDGRWQRAHYIEQLGCGNINENDGPEYHGPPYLSTLWIEGSGYCYLFDLEGWDTEKYQTRLKFYFTLDHKGTKPITVYSKPFILRHWSEMDYLKSLKAEQGAAANR